MTTLLELNVYFNFSNNNLRMKKLGVVLAKANLQGFLIYKINFSILIISISLGISSLFSLILIFSFISLLIKKYKNNNRKNKKV